MVFFKKQALHIGNVGLVLVLMPLCKAYNTNNNNNPWSNLLSRVTQTNNKESSSSEQLLEELNLQASTTPRLAYARLNQIPTLASASVSAISRGASGVFGSNYRVGIVDKDTAIYSYVALPGGQKQLQETALCKSPALPLVLYEYESDPSCRLVREACSILSLTVTIYPTPNGGKRYRKVALQEFGSVSGIKNQQQQERQLATCFPFLYDPNTKLRLVDSRRILDYLFATYGPPGGNLPSNFQQPPIQDKFAFNGPWLSAAFGVGLARWGAGGQAQDSTYTQTVATTEKEEDDKISKPLVLYGYEGSPFCKIVRERLSSLELPHTIIFTPRGSVNRQKLYELTGRCQVPYLQDPNTGINLFESEAIVEYLDKRYAIPTTPVQWM